MKKLLGIFLLSLFFYVPVCAQMTEFTYQGRLVDGSLAANGTYEMKFRLFDAETDGTQQPQGAPITLDFTVANGNAVVVSNGIFTVKLNFTAAAFPGAARFLEINVRRTAGDTFTTLNPRQPITSAPHNIRSLSSGSSDGLSVACVLCVTDAQIQSLDGSKVTGVVANATTAANVSGIVPIANGGTGSSTQNFVDLSTNQTNIAGNKTFTGILSGNGAGLTNVPGTFKWQTVSGLSQQAEPNKGYLVTADPQVNITLPETGNMNVGDIVRVSGVGAGGWKIFAGIGKSFVGLGFTPIIGWMPVAENQNWQSVASSADGNRLIAAANGGQLYTSTDSGFSWIPREFNRNWSRVASSADGNKLVAVVNGGQIYTSADPGGIWIPRETNRNWSGVASSADGSKLVANVNGGQVYTSTDSGVTWFPRETNRLWTSVASSADGSKLVATAGRTDS